MYPLRALTLDVGGTVVTAAAVADMPGVYGFPTPGGRRYVRLEAGEAGVDAVDVSEHVGLVLADRAARRRREQDDQAAALARAGRVGSCDVVDQRRRHGPLVDVATDLAGRQTRRALSRIEDLAAGGHLSPQQAQAGALLARLASVASGAVEPPDPDRPPPSMDSADAPLSHEDRMVDASARLKRIMADLRTWPEWKGVPVGEIVWAVAVLDVPVSREVGRLFSGGATAARLRSTRLALRWGLDRVAKLAGWPVDAETLVVWVQGVPVELVAVTDEDGTVRALHLNGRRWLAEGQGQDALIQAARREMLRVVNDRLGPGRHGVERVRAALDADRAAAAAAELRRQGVGRQAAERLEREREEEMRRVLRGRG